MFNEDKPIENLDKDLLGRCGFSKQLAKAIFQLDSTSSYTMSLEGKWGSGKTSIINMVIDEINKQNLEIEDDKRVIVVKFNPWNYTDTTQLIEQFFVELVKKLGKISDNEKMRDLGLRIEKYSDALMLSGYIPVIGKYAKLIPEILALVGKEITEQSEGKLNDITYRKIEVKKALEELDYRIIVIIDDIDRLTNEQIKLIFQLVNSIAGFPSIMYLLSYDKEVISRALSEVQNCNGNEYLEKIVQIPITVPMLQFGKVVEILREKLIDEFHVDNQYLYSERGRNIFTNCLEPFIFTLRDINRLVNTLKFSISILEDEVDLLDLVGITSLKLFATPIYDWIIENIQMLVGGNDLDKIDVNEVKNQYEIKQKEFVKKYKNPTVMINSIGSLFPKFAKKIFYPPEDLLSLSFDFKETITSDELYQSRRIGSEGKYSLYFVFNLDGIQFRKTAVNEALFQKNETELRLLIREFNDKGCLLNFYSEIQKNISRIPSDRSEILFRALLIEDDCKLMKNKTSQISRINSYNLEKILFRITDESKRLQIICDSLKIDDIEVFQYLLELFHTIELSFGKFVITEKINSLRLVDSEGVDSLEKIFIKRIRYYNLNYNIFTWKKYELALMLWREIDIYSFLEGIAGPIEDDMNAMKYLSMHIGISSITTFNRSNESNVSNTIKSFQIINMEYDDFFSNEKIEKLIIRRVKNDESHIVSDADIIKLTAFYMLITDTKLEKISDKEVKQQLKEWRDSNLKINKTIS